MTRPEIPEVGGDRGTWGPKLVAVLEDLQLAADSISDVSAAIPAPAGDGSADTYARSDHKHAGAGTNSTALGSSATATGTNGTAIGWISKAAGLNSAAIGVGVQVDAANSIAIGAGGVTPADSPRSISIGYNASVPAASPDLAYIKANDMILDRSNGTGETRIQLASPNGTKYWLSVSDAGALVITAD